MGFVLSTLRIKNLALVADLTVELEPGFCAITGETGTGKSVILGALHLVLGRRADRGALRSGAATCSVEAVFEIGSLADRLSPFLEERGLEPCEGGQLVLKRTFTASGTNRQFVNGSPTTLATLEEMGCSRAWSTPTAGSTRSGRPSPTNSGVGPASRRPRRP
jgi:DNA repair protein RecN (Recombination protein N)